MKQIILVLTLIASLFAQNENFRIAVVDFSSAGVSEKDAVYSVGSAEIVSTYLAMYSNVSVVERAQFAKLYQEMELQKSTMIDSGSAIEAGKVAGATYLLMGTWLEGAKDVTLSLRLVSVEDGTVQATAMKSDDPKKLLDIQKEAVEDLVADIKRIPPRELVVPTQSMEAFSEYSKAAQAYNRGQLKEADSYARSALKYDNSMSVAKQYLLTVQFKKDGYVENVINSKIFNKELTASSKGALFGRTVLRGTLFGAIAGGVIAGANSIIADDFSTFVPATLIITGVGTLFGVGAGIYAVVNAQEVGVAYNVSSDISVSMAYKPEGHIQNLSVNYSF